MKSIEKPTLENIKYKSGDFVVNQKGNSIKIFYQSWIPIQNIRANVIILHDILEHSARFARLVAALNEEGFAVFGMDYQGHGKSEGLPCYIDSHQNWFRDALQFYNLVCKKLSPSDSRENFIIGFGLGGLIASYIAVQKRDLKGIILLNPMFGIPADLKKELSKSTSKFKIKKQTVDYKIEYKCNNDEIMAQWKKDHLNFQDEMPLRTANQLVSAVNAFKDEQIDEKINTPLFMLLGEGDYHSCPITSQSVYNKIASVDKKLHIEKDARHDLLFENCGEKLTKEIVEWINKRSKAASMKLFSDEIREKWIKKQLRRRETEFTEIRSFDVIVGTWNVNSKLPKRSLKKWLRLDQFEADIYAIGLQEIDVTATALLKEETDSGETWSNNLINTFKDAKNKYVQLKAQQLVGIFTCVFIKEEHLKFVSDVRSVSVGCGIMGSMGNKGGVSIRFNFHGSSLCFSNAHLAAHQEAIMKRNQHFQEIMTRSVFGGGPEYLPENHDILFWFGDFNYRVNLPGAECRKRIRDKDYEYLLQHDQLSIEKKAGRVMQGFNEGKITFPPSYKFDTGTDIYDTSEKSRVPSYTDRILWKTKSSNAVTLKDYSMDIEYRESDHRPICAHFDIGIKVMIPEKYNKVYSEILSQLDAFDNDNQPQLNVSSNNFHFAKTLFGVPYTQILVLENPGQVVCEYKFLPKPGDDRISKRWLKVTPDCGILMPFEKVEISLTVCVDSSTAPELNNGEDTLDDILVLHLKNGRDYYISITGEFIKSCFGNTLETLAKNQSKLDTSAMESNNIPKELIALIEYIRQNGISKKGLFIENGTNEELIQIRQLLDSGASLELYKGSIHSIAESLITFLKSLSEPIIPYRYYSDCIRAINNPKKCENVVNRLPPVHKECFNYILNFMNEVLVHVKKSLDAERIVIVFATVLLQSPYGTANRTIEDQQASINFINNCLQILREPNEFEEPTTKRFRSNTYKSTM